MHRPLLQRLLEKGRALSKTNETKLRTAVAALQEVLAAVAGGLPINEAQQRQFQAAGLALLEAELSHDQQRQAVQKALRTATGTYCYVEEMYDTWLVYRCYDNTDTDQLYKVSYVVDGDSGAATFGQPVAVLARTVYEPVGALHESATGHTAETVRLVEAACVPLVERAVRSDGTVPIKVIQPGWGSSGYYPANVLERDGPEVFAAGTHMYWNHPTLSEGIERPERDLRDLAAVLESDARWEANGADGPGLYADARVTQSYAAAIEDLAANIGTSINTSGRATLGEADGRTGVIVEALMLDPFTSVDFVTKPGAGGKILQLFEAARPGAVPLLPGSTPMEEAVNEQEAQALRETHTRLEQDNARLRERLLLGEARGVVASHLANRTDLLEATRTRIADQLAARVDALPVVDGALDVAAYKTKIDEAVAIEAAYLSAVTGGSTISGMGGSGADAGSQHDTALVEASLHQAFASLGLSESAAKIAATGR